MTLLTGYIIGAALSIWPLYRGFNYMVKNDFPLSYAKGEASPLPFVIISVFIWPIGLLWVMLLWLESSETKRD